MTKHPVSDKVAVGKGAPKFKVGQIIVTTGKKAMPMRVLEVGWFDFGWFYRWNRNNWASEGMVRALTPEEIGNG